MPQAIPHVPGHPVEPYPKGAPDYGKRSIRRTSHFTGGLNSLP